MTGPILIMAGGTGGHVFPALALARRLREQSVEVVWLGTRRGLEARVVPADGIAIEWLSVGGLRGKGWRTLLAAPWRLGVALVQALRVMRRRQPALVVGLGGFVTGPGGVAAWLTRRPLHPCSSAHSFSDRSHPSTCHRHDPAGDPIPPTAWIARHTASRAASIRKPGASRSRRAFRSPIRRRDRSIARTGSSCACANRARKSSPACRIAAVIDPRRSMICSVSTSR